jgi:hypothetical protein
MLLYTIFIHIMIGNLGDLMSQVRDIGKLKKIERGSIQNTR